MTEPKVFERKGYIEFLEWCSKNNAINKWNNWYQLSDLPGISLRRASLEGADLDGVNLEGADLERANLLGANLREANLRGTDLRGTDLRGANLLGANLREANLRGTDLRGTDLRGANLLGADLEEANLFGTNLEGIDFINTNRHLFDKINYKTLNQTETALAQAKQEKENIEKQLKKSHDSSVKENKKLTELLQEKEKKESSLLKELETLRQEKAKETKDIEKIINFLASMPKEISQEQKYLEGWRFRFTLFGGFFLLFSVLLTIGLIVNVLCGNWLGLPAIDKIGQYLAYALSVGFPMGVSLLFYRQANLKSKEIDKINEKSILVQQVENALNSYNVLLSGNELKNKAITSIDRVMHKVFEIKHEQKDEKEEDTKVSISDIERIYKIFINIEKN